MSTTRILKEPPLRWLLACLVLAGFLVGVASSEGVPLVLDAGGLVIASFILLEVVGWMILRRSESLESAGLEPSRWLVVPSLFAVFIFMIGLSVSVGVALGSALRTLTNAL